MDFGRLTDETALPGGVLETLAVLLEQKKREREFGMIPRSPNLDSLIYAEVRDAEQRARRPAQRKPVGDIDAANAFLRDWIYKAA